MAQNDSWMRQLMFYSLKQVRSICPLRSKNCFIGLIRGLKKSVLIFNKCCHPEDNKNNADKESIWQRRRSSGWRSAMTVLRGCQILCVVSFDVNFDCLFSTINLHYCCFTPLNRKKKFLLLVIVDSVVRSMVELFPLGHNGNPGHKTTRLYLNARDLFRSHPRLGLLSLS